MGIPWPVFAGARRRALKLLQARSKDRIRLFGRSWAVRALSARFSSRIATAHRASSRACNYSCASSSSGEKREPRSLEERASCHRLPPSTISGRILQLPPPRLCEVELARESRHRLSPSSASSLTSTPRTAPSSRGRAWGVASFAASEGRPRRHATDLRCVRNASISSGKEHSGYRQRRSSEARAKPHLSLGFPSRYGSLLDYPPRYPRPADGPAP